MHLEQYAYEFLTFHIIFYLVFFIFLIILAFGNSKLAQTIIPLSILSIVILEIVGAVSVYILVGVGYFISYLPIFLIFSNLSSRVQGVFGESYHIFSFLVSFFAFYLPLLNYYLFIIIYNKVLDSDKIFLKFYEIYEALHIKGILHPVAKAIASKKLTFSVCLALPPLCFLFMVIVISYLGSAGILVFFFALFWIYLTVYILPVVTFVKSFRDIKDNHTKKWFIIAFFIPIAGSIVFLSKLKDDIIKIETEKSSNAN